MNKYIKYEQRSTEVLSDDKEIERKWLIKDVTSDVNYKNGHLAIYGIPK